MRSSTYSCGKSRYLSPFHWCRCGAAVMRFGAGLDPALDLFPFLRVRGKSSDRSHFSMHCHRRNVKNSPKVGSFFRGGGASHGFGPFWEVFLAKIFFGQDV